MGNFSRDRGDRFGGRDSRGGGGRSGRPDMHHAVCTDCGKDCEVPFRPTGEKPVFCSDCFSNKGDSGNNRNDRYDRNDRNDRHDRRSSDRSGGGFRDKMMFSAVCDKCHSDCEVPFRPSSDKPVFCDKCFGKGSRGDDGGNGGGGKEQHQKLHDELNSKLDYIIRLLAPDHKAPKKSKEETQKKEVKKVEAKKEVKKEEVKKTEKKVAPKKEVAAPKKVAKKAPAKKAVAKKAPAKKKVAAKKKK